MPSAIELLDDRPHLSCMEFRDYYQTLGVARDADADALKRAYRKLARRYHPDVSKEADAEERFKAVNEAYEVLKDPEKRAAYDQFGENWQQGQSFEPPPDWQANFDFGGGSFSTGRGAESGFSDFFDSLFGARGSPFGAQQARPANDVEALLQISIEDAFHGNRRAISLALPGANGMGPPATRTLNVKIPKGIQEGQRIRLEGQGNQGPAGRGDLFLRVQYLPHPQFQVDGKDVTVTVQVLPWQAALARSVKIPTLGGEVSMKLPTAVRSGQRLRLKGRGLPGSPAGDQYAIIEISVPAATGDEVRDLYEALEAAHNKRSK
ncbi:MAG: DnaJ C-terminal domain-containing protein [Pseudomonadales bacterium]